MLYKRIKGTKDILPSEVYQWQYIEKFIASILERYNYKEIRTPAFEVTELFTRSVGADTDIVSKEMYTFLDKGNISLTLKPELTAPVIRAYIQNHLNQISPVTKVYYIDALFRQERPQKGRFRQFHQFGYELIGSSYPEADVEIIQAIYEIYTKLGIVELDVLLNSIGSRDSRKRYVEALRSALEPYSSEFCSICQQRLIKNVLRLFDCKIESCQDILSQKAPSILDYLDKHDSEHFQEVKDLLNVIGIPYTVDDKLVRGLDYYTRTTFEIICPLLGAQDALCGGGRYDYLVEDLGGKPTPAVGVAAGMERLLLVLNEMEALPDVKQQMLYISTIGEDARTLGFKMISALRKQGIYSEMDFLRRSLKAQLRDADRNGALWVVIIGDDEIQRGAVILKKMSDGSQKEVPISTAVENIIKQVGK